MYRGQPAVDPCGLASCVVGRSFYTFLECLALGWVGFPREVAASGRYVSVPSTALPGQIERLKPSELVAVVGDGHHSTLLFLSLVQTDIDQPT